MSMIAFAEGGGERGWISVKNLHQLINCFMGCLTNDGLERLVWERGDNVVDG